MGSRKRLRDFRRGEYDVEEEINDEFPNPELNPSADVDNDVFEYESDLYYDEEDE